MLGTWLVYIMVGFSAEVERSDWMVFGSEACIDSIADCLVNFQPNTGLTGLLSTVDIGG